LWATRAVSVVAALVLLLGVVVGTIGSDPARAVASESDPLGLVTRLDETRRYTLGADVFEVWICPSHGSVGYTLNGLAAKVDTEMSGYFATLSGGRYDPVFVPAGTVPAGKDCRTWARQHPTGKAEGALIFDNSSTELAGPGYVCSPGASCPTTYPSNRREASIGLAVAPWSTTAHAIGHMISWPHSYTGATGFEYDNALDVMSGNYGIDGRKYGTYPQPYGTPAINRYAAGWIPARDVAVSNGSPATVALQPPGASGTQMLVIESGTTFYTFDARKPSSHDPIPDVWSGVEVYRVERCADCWGLNSRIAPVPGVPFDPADLAEYSQTLAHVMRVGDSIKVAGVNVRVTGTAGSGFRVDIAGGGAAPPPAGGSFADVASSYTFFNDIEWLAGEGITKGCNPPTNNRFCPDTAVTRGQMAAFLVRALHLTNNGGGNHFIDDNGSTFEADIAKLAAAGITKGCNPPTNNRFCPSTAVTRGQMAAFLHRALTR
jgi:hypothetical protein